MITERRTAVGVHFKLVRTCRLSTHTPTR